MGFNMAQASLSKFLKNSDFTTQKQLEQAYAIHLSVPAGNYTTGTVFEATVNVPSGIYVDNVTMQTSLKPDQNFPTNTYIVDVSANYSIILMCYQKSNSTYCLRAVVVDNTFVGTQVGSFTADATIHLSSSPY